MTEQKNADHVKVTDRQTVPVCPYCQRRFQSMDDLTLHIVTRHTHSGRTVPSSGPAATGSKS